MADVMVRIITWKQLRLMVPYIRQHILRLEKAGRFPKRVRPSARRVGWILSEVEAWIETLKARREEPVSVEPREERARRAIDQTTM